MSLYKHVGIFKRPALSYVGALHQEKKHINLHPVARIAFKFDPFHPKSAPFRDLLFIFSIPKIRETNLSCRIKTDIVSDLSEPEIYCKLTNGSELLFKTGNLTALEVVRELNDILKPLQLPPPPPEPSKKVIKLKSRRQLIPFSMLGQVMAKKYKGGGAVDAIDHVYSQLPAFTDIFDEETFYIFAFFVVLVTVLAAYIASKFITLKDHDD